MKRKIGNHAIVYRDIWIRIPETNEDEYDFSRFEGNRVSDSDSQAKSRYCRSDDEPDFVKAHKFSSHHKKQLEKEKIAVVFIV